MDTGRIVRARLLVRGIVQGVGFRPFTARLARRMGLSGEVRNTTGGVEIEVQGTEGDVAAFYRELLATPPPMALILSVEREELPTSDAQAAFEIRASRADPAASVIVPPDIGLCASCRAEIEDPADRRRGYPFVNCTDCGPRYTVIRGVPYDRPRTSMAGFALCPDCAREYGDPADRRFHAQPIACPACGPRLSLKGAGGGDLPGDPLEAASAALKAGEIVALLGVGGFHLACDADDEVAVSLLRERKKRPAKPLAVMAADLPAAEEVAELDDESHRLLLSPAAPILLCPARRPSPLAPSVAPGQESVGLFLPYTPLHHLLFRRCALPRLVMTSGNRSDEPILSTWEEAREKLLGVADLFLVHDRPIVHPVDDSVAKRMGRLGSAPVRRARGYAPRPVPLPGAPSRKVTLALGAELLATVTVAREGLAFIGPHVGDLKNPETEDGFRRGAVHLLDLLGARPDRVACDLHPAYRSTACAEEWEQQGLPLVRIQHHEAHGAACMAENGFTGEGIVLALDGVGLGHDRTVWGGEILVGRPGRFRRAGHLVPVPQPGGDRAASEPWRMAASQLRSLLGERWLELPLPALREQGEGTLRLLDAMMAKEVNAPLTSSCGRLFDAAAAILGFRGVQGRILYTAQAPMELEAAASRAHPRGTPGERSGGAVRTENGTLLLDPGPILLELLEGALGGESRDDAALWFHEALADLFSRGALQTAQEAGLRDIFLTGGCLQNAILAEGIDRRLSAEGLRVYHHREVPPNDGGVSYGQAAWLALADG